MTNPFPLETAAGSFDVATPSDIPSVVSPSLVMKQKLGTKGPVVVGKLFSDSRGMPLVSDGVATEAPSGHMVSIVKLASTLPHSNSSSPIVNIQTSENTILLTQKNDKYLGVWLDSTPRN